VLVSWRAVSSSEVGGRGQIDGARVLGGWHRCACAVRLAPAVGGGCLVVSLRRMVKVWCMSTSAHRRAGRRMVVLLASAAAAVEVWWMRTSAASCLVVYSSSSVVDLHMMSLVGERLAMLIEQLKRTRVGTSAAVAWWLTVSLVVDVESTAR
jgi:hypothetical protein